MCRCVVPEPNSLNGDGNKALQALVMAMEERDLVGIARCATVCAREGGAHLWTCDGRRSASQLVSLDLRLPPVN